MQIRTQHALNPLSWWRNCQYNELKLAITFMHASLAVEQHIYRRFNYLSERAVCWLIIWQNCVDATRVSVAFAVVLWWKLHLGLLCDFRPTMFAMMGAKVTKAPLSCAPMALCSIRRSSPATGGTMSTAQMPRLSTGMWCAQILRCFKFSAALQSVFLNEMGQTQYARQCV